MAAKLCNICGIRRVYTGTGPGVDLATGHDMCNYCFTEGGWENEHEDNDHITAVSVMDTEDPAIVAKLKEAAGCWICHPNLNLAQKYKKASTGPKTQGARRQQFNHKGHNHPQTPAARRACKNAFWALADKLKLPVKEVGEAMAAWDCSLDGHGKPVAPKTATWHVAPKGKTRSVQSTGK